MPELAWVANPSGPALRTALRARLADLGLRLRVVAEDLLGAEAPIDLLALDPQGGVVLVLVAAEGEELALVGRALAQRSWVEARLRDWVQLAPRLGIEPEAGVRLLLLAPRFEPTALAAAAALGGALVGLATFRSLRNGSTSELLLEPVPLQGAERAPARNGAAHPPVSRFRSGLGDADLSLTPQERQDLE